MNISACQSLRVKMKSSTDWDDASRRLSSCVVLDKADYVLSTSTVNSERRPPTASRPRTVVR